MDLVEIFEKEQIKQKPPQIHPGDKVKVYQKIKEVGKTRTQSFEGIVIRMRKMKTARANFTVRKIASGIGVEKTFFIHSPNITKIKILKKGKVRRAKLYYIRERQGKAAKMKEKKGELGEWEIATAETPKESASKKTGQAPDRESGSGQAKTQKEAATKEVEKGIKAQKDEEEKEKRKKVKNKEKVTTTETQGPHKDAKDGKEVKEDREKKKKEATAKIPKEAKTQKDKKKKSD